MQELVKDLIIIIYKKMQADPESYVGDFKIHSFIAKGAQAE